MRKFAAKLVQERNGQSLVEYALILSLVAMVCVAALSGIGRETNRLLPELQNAIAGGGQ